MDAKAIPELWAQARKLLQEELDEEDWHLFNSRLDPDSPKEVVESLGKQQNQARHEYSDHVLKIKDKKIFDFNVGRIMKRFSILCQMVDSTMTFAPESASIVWTTFRLLTRFLLEDQELCEFLSGALDRISDAIFVGDILAHRYFKATSKIGRKIREGIPQLYKTVLKFSVKTKKLFPEDDKKRTVTKITRSLKAVFGKTGEIRGLVDEAKSQLDWLLETVDIDFKIVVADAVKETGLDVKEIKELWLPEIASGMRMISEALSKSIEETEKKKIDEEYQKKLNWLQTGTALALFQPQDQHAENIKKRSPDTGQWIFEHESYTAWISASTPKERILLLSGAAGAGKSILTSSVIEKLSTEAGDEEKPLVLFFFCKVGNDAKQNGEKIMLHLLLQLFNEIGNLKSTSKSRAADEWNIKKTCTDVVHARAKMDKSELANSLKLSTMTSMFVDITECLRRKVFVILDALDECADWSREDSGLLQSLIDMSSNKANISLFISSRPDADAEKELSTHTCRIHVDKSMNEKDIRKFVNHQLGRKLFSAITKEDKKMARRAILAKSEGMFQYAVVALQTLNSGKSMANFPRAIHQLPHGMNQLYARQYQSLEDAHRINLRIILRWLVCAEGAIKAAPIVDEIGEKYNDFDKIEQPGRPEESHVDRWDESDESYESYDSYDSYDSHEESGNEDSPSPDADQTNDRAVVAMKLLSKEFRDFIKFDSNADVVSLHHKSIRDWILEDANYSKALSDCPACRKRELEDLSKTLQIAPKYGHLHMACSILRTLNNPRFQEAHVKGRSYMYMEADGPRYELTHWTFHVRMAEQYWPKHERSDQDVGVQWATLYDDIESFMSSKAFRKWSRQPKLHFAAQEGLLGTLQRLVDNGEDINILDTTYRNLLHVLCMGRGNYIGLDYLLDTMDQEQVNLQEFCDQSTPLHVLLSMRQPTVNVINQVQLLIEHGADLTLLCSNSSSYLFEAVRGNDPELCRLLLASKEFDVNLQDSNGASALHFAPSVEIAELLIDHGADINLRSENGDCLLIHAIMRGDNDTACFSLDHGAEVNVKIKFSGTTALHEAVGRANSTVVKLLVDKGADILAADYERNSPLHAASALDSSYILEYLLEKQKARANDTRFLLQTGQFYQTALHLASFWGCVANVQLLLESGQPGELCSQKDGEGRTPLHTAAFYGYDNIFRLLVKSGARLDCVDDSGHTPFDLIISRWRDSIDDSRAGWESVLHSLLPLSPNITQKRDLLEMAIEMKEGSMCSHLATSNLVNEIDAHGWTPLLLAAQEEEQHIVDILSRFDTSSILDRLSSVEDTGIGHFPAAINPKTVEQLTISEDGLTLDLVDNCDTLFWGMSAALTDHPLPAGISRYYYEVLIEDGNHPMKSQTSLASIVIGFCSRFTSQESREVSLDSKIFSQWSYHCDGRIYQLGSKSYHFEREEEFGHGDVVGAGIDFRERTVFFTKNGKRLGESVPFVSSLKLCHFGTVWHAELCYSGLDCNNQSAFLCVYQEIFRFDAYD
ncbi:hypothetical protein JOL62DRAFT_173792 [Phyllosticta paracitricarpa]|uniref:Protein ssh4 n=1 Tax=Phyllosticta paracitricarpa TaxID=2016321 RepID=A0ABR1N2H9_9PEZI